MTRGSCGVTPSIYGSSTIHKMNSEIIVGFRSFFLDPSGEDEEQELCQSFKCNENYVKCGDKLRCILIAELCDGKEDCTDGSDETALEFAPGKVNNCTERGDDVTSEPQE